MARAALSEIPRLACGVGGEGRGTCDRENLASFGGLQGGSRPCIHAALVIEVPGSKML